MIGKLKQIFSLTVNGQPSKFTSDELVAQINNNLTVMSWMWLILLITLSGLFVVQDLSYKIFLATLSIFIFQFISSLHNSQKQNRIILELRGDKNV